MFTKPSMITRITIGKSTAILLVLLGYLVAPAFWAAMTWQFQAGFFLWYVIIGASIGAFGMMGPVPVLNLTLRWWWRGPWLGAVFNLVLSLFIWADLSALQGAVFGATSLLSSPVFFIIEGALVGLIIDFLCTRVGGEGPVLLR